MVVVGGAGGGARVAVGGVVSSYCAPCVFLSSSSGKGAGWEWELVKFAPKLL